MSIERSFRIGKCLVEQDLDRVSCGSMVVSLRPQVMEVLVYLASNQGKVVNADELLDDLWSGKIVTSASIYNCMSELRNVFQKCDPSQQYIETVARKGYRLLLPVEAVEEPLQSGNGSQPVSQKNKKRLRLVAVAVIVAMTGLLAIFLQQGDEYTEPELGPHSIVVLPFASKQDDELQLYADGLLGAILTGLSEIEAITPIARVTAERYRGTKKPIRTIASELGVAYVMSGALIEVEGQMRLDLELADAGTSTTQWAQSYPIEQGGAGVFGVQADIANHVASTLQVKISPSDLEPVSTVQAGSDLAYYHFLRGEVYRQRSEFPDAIEELRLATDTDPQFAAAWASLAMSLTESSYLGVTSEAIERAEYALDHARRLAPNAPETRMAEAVFLFYQDASEEAASLLLELIRLRPGWVEPVIKLAGNYTVRLRLDEASELAERAVMLDPMNVDALWQLAFIRAWSWDFEAAKRYYDRCMALEPERTNELRFWMRWDVYYFGLGDTDAARRMLDEAPASFSTITADLYIAYLNRDWPVVESLLALPEAEGGYALFEAQLHRARGDSEGQKSAAKRLRVNREIELEAMIRRGAPQIDIEAARSWVAVALALDGNEAEALRTIQIAIDRAATSRDRLNTVWIFFNEVRTYMYLGKTDQAVERLRELLSWASPPWLTPYRLQTDPDFDDLRGHPEFQLLLEALTEVPT